jgi:diketogulonate reductase-like aldo/keto reductase
MVAPIPIPNLKLSNGCVIPNLGISTYRKMNETLDLEKPLNYAISNGYRLIDTAWVYFNDEAIKKVIQENCHNTRREEKREGNLNLKREELFICSKLWNIHHSKKRAINGIKNTLKTLGLDYLDAFFVNWPMGFQECDDNEPYPKTKEGKIAYSDVHYLDTYAACEESCENKLIRSIGLSNFNIKQCEDVLKNCKIKPTLNRIEVNPYFQNDELVSFCQNNNITVVAYLPLGAAELTSEHRGDFPNLLEDQTLIRIGKVHKKTPAQIALRWSIQRGLVPIPKAVLEKHIDENMNVFDFKLSQEEMNEIKKLNRNLRICTFSEVRDHPFYPFN